MKIHTKIASVKGRDNYRFSKITANRELMAYDENISLFKYTIVNQLITNIQMVAIMQKNGNTYEIPAIITHSHIPL